MSEIQKSTWSGLGFRAQGFRVTGSAEVFRHFGPFSVGTRIRAVHLVATAADDVQLGFRVAMHQSVPTDDASFLSGELLTVDSHTFTGIRILIDSGLGNFPVFLNYDVDSSRQFLVCQFIGVTSVSSGCVSVELG